MTFFNHNSIYPPHLKPLSSLLELNLAEINFDPDLNLYDVANPSI